ncbi:hypothetical protein ACFWA6_29525 [Streptomyces sp. NPDC060020]|uniref:hypothetical protein n=1 Tax=Streptomyces sp. NPDC060020 TaxID=3347038 RepID=UPI00369D75BF
MVTAYGQTARRRPCPPDPTRLRAKLSKGYYGEDNFIPKATVEEYKEIQSGHGHH